MVYDSPETSLRVRISRVSLDEETGLYEATLDLVYESRAYSIKISNLLRSPIRARARVENEYLVISLDDNEGKPLSTCCIHVKHIECGCMDCKNLIVPPCAPER